MRRATGNAKTIYIREDTALAQLRHLAMMYEVEDAGALAALALSGVIILACDASGIRVEPLAEGSAF